MSGSVSFRRVVSVRRCALLFAFCWLSSCGPRVGPGGSAFTRVESAHFAVYADRPVAEVEQKTRELENLLASFLAHGWETHGELPLRVNVVMLSDAVQLRELTGEQVDGYMYTPLLFEPWIVVPWPDRHHNLEIVSHELTHYLAFQVMPHQPLWFAEGLAGYFETALIRGGEFVLGRVPISLLASITHEGLLGHAALFDDAADHTNTRYYGSAWLLVHYLMSEHADAFVAYQTELARGLSHAQAWSIAFPTLPGPQLDRRLAAYLSRSEYVNVSFPARSVDTPLRSTPLRRADEEALWAILWTGAYESGKAPRDQGGRRRELALTLDPDQPQALALRALADPGSQAALDATGRLTARSADLGLAWLTRALVLEKNDMLAAETPSPADRALALMPRQPFAIMLKAYELARRGERNAALRMSRRAERLQPSNASLLWQRAFLLAGLGECAPLLGVTRTLRQVGHAKLSAEALLQLVQLQADCAQR